MSATDPDLELAHQAVTDDAAWNAIASRFGDTILAGSMAWCEGGCRIPRGDYDCILRTIRAQRPEPAEAPEGCREGLVLYQHACAELRPALARFDGQTSLEAFVLAALAEIRLNYLGQRQGRLSLPTALEGASELALGVYRLATRVRDRSEVARALEQSEDEVARAEREVATRLSAAGLSWWGLEPRLESSESPTPAPAWVQRGVLAGGDAPEPAKAGDTWFKRASAQPDWWLGLALGAVVTTVALVIVIPRQDYAKAVTSPTDEVLARAESPLEPKVADHLVRAREALAKGRVDAAIQELDSVLAVRADSQEARWLLASTYDHLGDRARAAKHYKLYLDVDARARQASESRLGLARERLQRWSEMP